MTPPSLQAPTYTPEQVFHVVDIIDRHKPVPEMKAICLECWQELRKLFDHGDITPEDFRESQNVLWRQYEASAEAGLPEGQKQRLGAFDY